MVDDNTPAQVLGAQIAKRREMLGKSQRDMAAITGIQQATVSKIEIGERVPTRPQAQALAKFFDYALTELHLAFPETYPPPPINEPERAVA